MITKRNIARGMMAAGSLVYLLGIWRTCPLFSGKGYFLGVLVMGMFAVLAHQRASQWQEQDDGFIALCRLVLLLSVGLLLVGAWFTAIGIFASSMTGSQIISGIITIGLLVLIFFMGLIPVVWGEFPAAGIFHYMSCSEHLDRFSAGLVDTRPVVFYLTMTVLTLAVTIRIIDHRRWKH